MLSPLPSSRLRAPRRVAVGVSAAACALLACDEPPPVGMTPSIDRSDLVSVATVGADPAGDALYRVKDGVLLPDGSFVIAVGSELRAYTRTGERRWTVGGEGFGPGEFQSLARIEVLPPDRIAAWDRSLMRLSVFRGNTIERTIRPDLSDLRALRPRFVGVTTTPDGAVVLVLEDRPSPLDMASEPSRVRRDTLSYFAFGADQRPVRPFFRTSSRPYYFWNHGRYRGKSDLILGDRLVEDVLPDGLLVGHGDTGRFELVSFTGERRRIGRAPVEARTYTPRVREEERRRRREAVTDLSARTDIRISAPGLRESRLRAVEETPANTRAGAFDRLEATTLRWITVRRPYLEGDSTRTWLSFGEGLTPCGSFLLAPDEEILDVDDRAVLTLATDRLGIETVRLYRFEADPASRTNSSSTPACPRPGKLAPNASAAREQ